MLVTGSSVFATTTEGGLATPAGGPPAFGFSAGFPPVLGFATGLPKSLLISAPVPAPIKALAPVLISLLVTLLDPDDPALLRIDFVAVLLGIVIFAPDVVGDITGRFAAGLLVPDVVIDDSAGRFATGAVVPDVVMVLGKVVFAEIKGLTAKGVLGFG